MAEPQPNCAKRMECVELAPAFAPSIPFDSASKLDALHTLRDSLEARRRPRPCENVREWQCSSPAYRGAAAISVRRGYQPLTAAGMMVKLALEPGAPPSRADPWPGPRRENGRKCV